MHPWRYTLPMLSEDDNLAEFEKNQISERNIAALGHKKA
jgi:hypothetical protein